MLANKRDPVLPVGHGLGGVSEGRDLERFWCEVFKWLCHIYPAGDQHILFRLSNRLAGCHSHWIYFFFFVVSQVGVIYVGRFFICGFKKQGTCECLNGINGVNRMQIIFSLAKVKVQSRVFHRIISWSFHNGGWLIPDLLAEPFYITILLLYQQL